MSSRSPAAEPQLRRPRGPARFSATLDTLLRNLGETGRGRKQALSVAIDAFLVVASLWAAYSLRHGMPFSDFRSTWHLFLLLPTATVLAFGGLGIYRWVIRSSNQRMFRQLVKGGVLSALALVMVVFLAPPDRVTPRSLFVIYGLLLIVGTCGVRLVWQGLFGVESRGMPIAVYGAGEGGRRLVNMLAASDQYRPVVFLDDDRRKHGSTVAGLPVVSGIWDDLEVPLRRREVVEIVIAIPSLGGLEFEAAYSRLVSTGLPVRTMPDLSELVSAKTQSAPIRDISIGDILGRSEVTPDDSVMGQRVKGRNVLVTGGGGSIGSELCRQISRLEPARLVVLDLCEANLYQITEELVQEPGTLPADGFVPLLGSVTDTATVERLFREHQIDTVYHAAAYKHVPIVERQPERGVETNVFGTLTVLDAAIASGARDFVLISTDKAVRPTNAMGATKRIAELVLQAKAREDHGTRISMVRFGNVLGSSGSVVPKFKKQILSGGPVTVTHPDITRYFMTIPEAAQLVLQASAIATGGDVFVLDMGAPVRIVDLAETMVRLYGKRLRSETGSPEDIEIVFEGLRPGEKMHEELFISESCRQTSISKVMTAEEAWISWSVLEERLSNLKVLVKSYSETALRMQLLELAMVPNNAGLVGVEDRRENGKEVTRLVISAA